VVLERQNLEEMLARLGQEEDTAQGDGEGGESSSSSGGGNVFGSSMSMFGYIKTSIRRCTALTTGQTFLSLTKEFKICIQQYVEMLRLRCPPSIGLTGLFKLPPGQEVVICYLVNTAEYCSDVSNIGNCL
jgi:hypothetical protein